MSIYQKYILPRIINRAMQDERNSQERARLIPKASGVVLDIGFGSGLNLPFYSTKVRKLFALDPSRELWELAKERIDKISLLVEFIQASAEKIPLDDNSVDTIVMTWTLCSVTKPEQALKEMRRVSKNGGELLFVEHGQSQKAKIQIWQNLLNPIWTRIAGGCNLNRKVESLIADAGFEISELEIDNDQSILRHQYKGVARVRK